MQRPRSCPAGEFEQDRQLLDANYTVFPCKAALFNLLSTGGLARWAGRGGTGRGRTGQGGRSTAAVHAWACEKVSCLWRQDPVRTGEASNQGSSCVAVPPTSCQGPPKAFTAYKAPNLPALLPRPVAPRLAGGMRSAWRPGWQCTRCSGSWCGCRPGWRPGASAMDCTRTCSET